MLSILALSAGLAVAAASSPTEPWVPPAHLHYSKSASFRGLAGDGTVAGYDTSGHATVLPGVHDFVRLVPPSPLAHGAVFSENPIKSKEWVAEIAFRLHGPPTAGVTEMDQDGTVKKLHKGGRGLAFWYTKEGLPGPITLSSNPKVKPNPPPPAGVDARSDPLVSLFGSRIAFDGLGVVFDTSPNAPLWKHSDPRLTEQDQPWGVGASGVVSGIMDDGTGGWLDKNDRVMAKGDEAGYLERAIGECEAAFRNAQGLLWARISHVANTIRVSYPNLLRALFDLSPHTTLAKAGRDYAHNCFTLDGVNLTPGSFIGISGLASGNTEPDTIDIYAMDVFEVLEAGDPGYDAGLEEPIEEVSEEPLEGTTGDAIPTLTHEIFLSQAKMVEAIDALSRKIESLSHTVSAIARGSSPEGGKGGSADIPSSRVDAMERHLQDLVSSVNGIKGAGTGGASAASNEQHSESLTHLVQLQDRLLVELQSFGHKLDNSNSASSASLSTLTSRTSELLTLLKQTSGDLEKATAIPWMKWVYAAFGLVLGAGLMRWREKQRRDDVWGTRKML
ncbi:uncharacterized protein JCM15063_004934 [Sporobolomyces koalae]|uniref:uncharacterized protein n=1 Tax=Sporobolomyces koalae TaxID=500713 RepID=UPI00317F369C